MTDKPVLHTYKVTTPSVYFASVKFTFSPPPNPSDPVPVEKYDIPPLEVVVKAENEENAKEQALTKLVETHRLTPMDVDLIRKYGRSIDWIVGPSWYELDW
jgi:hypothetical protein